MTAFSRTRGNRRQAMKRYRPRPVPAAYLAAFAKLVAPADLTPATSENLPMSTVSTVPTPLARLDESRRRTEAMADLRRLLRLAMSAARAAAYGAPDPSRFLALGQGHAGLGDLARAVAELSAPAVSTTAAPDGPCARCPLRMPCMVNSTACEDFARFVNYDETSTWNPERPRRPTRAVWNSVVAEKRAP